MSGEGKRLAAIGRPLRTELDYFRCDVTGPVLEELLDVSHETIRRRANDGALVKVSRGRYDLVASLRKYFSYLEQVAGGRGGEDAQAQAAIASARLKTAQAEREEMKLAVERGELVDAKAVERQWSQDWKTVSSSMLSVPTRIAQDMPHLARTDIAAIDRIIREALQKVGQVE